MSRARTIADFGDGIADTDLFSGFANGVTQADAWRLTANVTANGDITTNLERVDESSSGIIGTGMTESSGIFSFPVTGIYLVLTNAYFSAANGDGTVTVATQVTVDNSNYDVFAQAVGGNRASSDAGNSGASTCVIDVTDTANVKVKFNAGSITSPSAVFGSTDENRTSFTFIRLGDT